LVYWGRDRGGGRWACPVAQWESPPHARVRAAARCHAHQHLDLDGVVGDGQPRLFHRRRFCAGGADVLVCGCATRARAAVCAAVGRGLQLRHCRRPGWYRRTYSRTLRAAGAPAKAEPIATDIAGEGHRARPRGRCLATIEAATAYLERIVTDAWTVVTTGRR